MFCEPDVAVAGRRERCGMALVGLVGLVTADADGHGPVEMPVAVFGRRLAGTLFPTRPIGEAPRTLADRSASDSLRAMEDA